MAMAWLDAGRAQNALPALEQLSHERPDRIEYQVGLAHAYARLRRIEDCRRIAAGLAERFPGSPQSLVAAAMLAISARRVQAALKLLKTAKSGDGANPSPTPEMCVALGHAYLRLRLYVEARATFAAALEMDSDCVEAHAGLSAVLLAEGDPAAAAASARRSIALQPDSPAHHYQLANALSALGDYRGSRDALLLALTLEPDSPATLRKLSGVYHRLGDLKAAHKYDLDAHLALVNRRLMSKPRPRPGMAPEASESSLR
jgi:tetratricopeptide (TPR) repeat protein